MSTKNQKLEIRWNAKTPTYNKVKKDVKKLLTATAATYIPELCNALRQDLFPHTSDSTFAMEENKGIRDEIRARILDDWSNQRNWSDSPWGDDAIHRWFPDWLRHPAMLESNKINQPKAAAAKKYLQNLRNSDPKIFSERTISQLPEIPKQLESKAPAESEDEDEGDVSYSGGKIHVSPEKPKPEPRELYGEIVHGLAKAWYTLTDTNRFPGSREDALVDFIKPSEKHRLRILKGLDDADSTNFLNVLYYADLVIRRTIDAWNEIQKEPSKRIGIQ